MAKEMQVVDQDGVNPLTARIAKLGLLDVGSADVVAFQIAQRIMDSETAEDVLAEQTLPDAEEFMDQAIQVNEVGFLKSDFEGGLGLYAVIAGQMVGNGEAFRFSCGGTNVVAQLAKLMELDALPVNVVLTKAARPSAQGFFPLWLRPA